MIGGATRVRVIAATVALLVVPVVSAHAQTTGTSAWPATQALPHFSTVRHLDVADVESLPGDQQLLFDTLEGVVNRSRPRIYLLWGADEGKRTWLDTLHNDYGVPLTDVANPWDLLTSYRAALTGMVV